MTTFISYSRVHSEFVVRLARDLKSAGFDVWLDQLDIPKGARWDDAIEAAVERSSTFMIVLSPESIESQNVKDELSYAIDAGKNILPVVIKPCKIPLRLRRFQYVDFTDKPYKESLADIKHLLSNTKRIVKAPAEEPSIEPPAVAPVFTGPLIQKEPQPEPEPLPRRFEPEEPTGVNPLRKFIVPVILAVIALAAIIGGLAFAANRNNPNAASPSMITLSITSSLPALTSTSTLTPLPPPQEIIDEAGLPMRLVSEGEFQMGSDNAMADEKPVETLFLETFYIDKYEVTNASYRECVDAGPCKPPKEPSKKAGANTLVGYYNEAQFDNYPVVFVDWNMAKAYCEWRSARLPTEAEWEKAARGPDGRRYPWGNEISCNEANYFGCEGGTVSVSSFGNGRSVSGVYNMAGNVSEWVSSLYKPYPYDPHDGREDPDAPGERVVRGGSWLNSDNENEVRAARRDKADPKTAAENIGFRCAFSAAIPETGALLSITPQNASTATRIAATIRSVKTREADQANATFTLTPVATATARPGATTAVPVSATLTVPSDTDTPVPPDTDTPVPPDTDTPVPPDTDTPVPPDTDTPVPPDTDTPVPDTPIP